MPKVALIETKPSKTNFKKEFEFDFDQYQLCSDPTVKKVLKRDKHVCFGRKYTQTYKSTLKIYSDFLKLSLRIQYN